MKTVSMNSVYLKGGSFFVTPDPSDAYRVSSGSVYVYIVPWDGKKVGRRTLLCEAPEGTLIPSFVYRDLDYQRWRFCFVAVEEATLTCLPDASTKPLRNRFLIRAGIRNAELEGYENSLVDFYRMKLVQEDGYLIRTEMEKEAMRRRTDSLISSLFSEKKETIAEKGEQALYEIVSILCSRTHIPIAPYERVKECCTAEMDIKDIARVSHFPCRDIVLEENWYRQDAGALLVYFGDTGEPAACVPRGQGGYTLWRIGQAPTRVTKNIAGQCAPKAVMLYRPFPGTGMNTKDLVRYCIQGLSRADFARVLVLTVLSSLIGLLIPTLNQQLYDQFIPMGKESQVIQVGILIASFMTGNIAFSIVKELGTFRINSHVRYQMQNAIYFRVFELPEHFFRNYESADLAGRIMQMGDLAGQMTELLLSVLLTTVMAVFYLIRMIQYSPGLSAISLIMMIAIAAVVYMMADKQLKYRKKSVELEGRSDSVMYQFLNGITKIRIAGIEERAIYEYMKPFVELRKLEDSMGKLSGLSSVISSIGSAVFSMVIYTVVYQGSSITMGIFVAFNSAMGMVSSAVSGLSNSLMNYRMLRPSYDRLKAILMAEPENSGFKKLPGTITGHIDVDHLAFSYGEDLPPVFEDLSIHIKEGEYIGIVGSSGCGKSTLLKLLLGFERPISGRIYYDNQDMGELDLQELRKRFGVVLQDGELISGSIFENITLTAPTASLAEVERAVAEVGLKKDIEQMPMGLHTVVSENCNTISGGQKQRILIARAIIGRPRIVFFDEATSALDNITQSMVCDTLERMDSTRLVIAHRLSTIRRCDRILVFDQGNIAEEGTYKELMDRHGLFYELASRQLMEG